MTREFHPSDGRKLDPKQCRAAVSNERRFFQCSNNAKVDGWCGTHSPAAGARRKAKADKRYEDWRMELKAKEVRRDRTIACVNALAGLDPSKLAALLAACERICSKGMYCDHDVGMIRNAYRDLKGEA